MTLKELLELGVKEGVIVEEQPSVAKPDKILFKNFSAKIHIYFSIDELESSELTDLDAENLLMMRTSSGGGMVGCEIIWDLENGKQISEIPGFSESNPPVVKKKG